MHPGIRWPRAVLVAAWALLLGAAGHAAAGGLLPGPATMTALLAVATVAAAGLLGRPASRLRLVALLVGGQAAVHVALSATAGHVGDGAAPAPHVEPGPARLPAVDGRRVGSLQDAWEAGAVPTAPSLPAGGLPGHLVGHLTEHAPMMAAHVLAAALVGLWLAAGERCLWTLVALAGGAVRGRLALVTALVGRHGTGLRVGPPARPHRTSYRPPPAAATLLARCLVRRGPPALPAA